MVQVPDALKVTFPVELIEHTELEDELTVSFTVSPEVEVAVGVYVPPTVALLGAVLVNVMV
jgi:hypothetical protein